MSPEEARRVGEAPQPLEVVDTDVGEDEVAAGTLEEGRSSRFYGAVFRRARLHGLAACE